MKKINAGSLFPLTALILLIYILSHQLADIFPLGKMLDPFIGAVQNNEGADPAARRMDIDGLQLHDSAAVYFDSRRVPHIYASSDNDLYKVQGYVTATLRLWQMDFLSYASAGRLSEIFSEGFLDYDRGQRRLGILEAARRSLAMIEKDTATDRALTAYTAGVNAYIRGLSYKNMPFEYKLLDYKPEPWTKLKTVLVMKYMAFTLSGYEEDYSMTGMMLALGEDAFNKFYPDIAGPVSPMTPGNERSSEPIQRRIGRPGYLDYSFLSTRPVVQDHTYNPKLGSNSWAVSGKRTRSGHPILCSDPHLNLSLPAIWLEMQLSCPGMNVYGVSIPGTPAVVIGFNENIAWGLTNGADDARDWYKLRISPDYTSYLIDGKWLKMDQHTEVIMRRDRKPFYDTVYWTVQGPVVNTESFSQHPELKDHALRWALHDPSDEFLTFMQLSRARDYKDYREALTHYSCPIQNFTFAGRDNTIAAVHQGRMPRKYPGEGKFILDGTRSDPVSRSYIPQDSLPAVVNPSCNYVFTANQPPADGAYPYYYNGYFSENRANRIRQVLEKDSLADVRSMEALQLDNINPFATAAISVLIAVLDTSRLAPDERNAVRLLRTWNGAYDASEERAGLFELWWRNVKNTVCETFRSYPFFTRLPDDYVLLDLIRDKPEDACFDRQATPGKETARDIADSAFREAWKLYSSMKSKGSVRWADNNAVNILHPTNIAALSRTGMPSAGYPEAVNAMSSGWGPSWRMVVELGDRPNAYGIYPGGQTGNVGSRRYDEFVNDWNKGHYYHLQFFMTRAEAAGAAGGRWLLK